VPSRADPVRGRPCARGREPGGGRWRSRGSGVGRRDRVPGAGLCTRVPLPAGRPPQRRSPARRPLRWPPAAAEPGGSEPVALAGSDPALT